MVKPASTSRHKAASRTQRAIGPTTSRIEDSGTTPALGTRAWVGLMPTNPCAEAGFWIEPPVSSAKPNTAIEVATAVAVPAELAPGTRSGMAALIVGPAQLSLAWLPLALSTGTLVLPSMIVPAARMRATTGLSASGMRSTPPLAEYSRDQPAVVGKPFMSIGSLITTGTPASGPSFSPAAILRSISRASANASGLRKMIAL